VNLRYFASRASKLAADNSTTIFTAIGVTGVITTAYLTARASHTAAGLLLDEKMAGRDGEDALDIREKIDLTWKLYIPPAMTGAVTIACIIAANRVGTRRAAALAAAYTLSEKAIVEYKEKVVEKFGEKKEQEVRDELARDRIHRNPDREVVIIEGDSVRCFEAYTGRYFTSNIETLKKAQNTVNHQVLHSYYASLSDFYEEIGLPRTAISDEIGWNVDRLLDLKFSAILPKDGRPCISFDYDVVPIRDYNRIS
jgi:hypothetical protein